MRLRALLALVFGATGLLTILLLGNSLLKQRDALRLIEAQRQRFVSEQLADELRQSSDDLTRMARTYAVTGDEKFMRFFDQIQAIRSGEAPRPIGYEAVYWDLVLNPADHEASAKAAASALQSRMIDAGFSVQEFALLQKAEKESEALIALERIAMNAVRGRFDDGTGVFAIVKPPDREMAVRLLHGEQYHVAKANIMAPIKEFTAGATGRMRTLTAGLEADMQRRLEISSALLVAILVVLVAGYVATIRLVLRPVRALSDAALRLQRGEWVEIAAAGGTRELGALVDTFNRMSSALEDREREKAEAMQRLAEKAEALEQEKARAEKLLLNVLPASIVDRMQRGEQVSAESFPEVTVFFADVVGFTSLAAEVEPRAVAKLLNELFGMLDELADKYRLEKIKTIGDCYMAVAGVPERSPTHAQQMADLALEAIARLNARNQESPRKLQIRIGMHSGTVVAGIIGSKKFAYDLWGDVVNVTNRLQGSAEPMRIHVSESLYARLSESYTFEERGEIDLKNRGRLRTFNLVGRKESVD